MRFGPVVMTYFIIGAVMWGGGALAFQQAGVVGVVFDDVGAGGVDINSSTSEQIQRTGGPIQEAVSSVGGAGLLAIYNIAAGFIGYIFWPITALAANDAPPRAIVLLGGIFTMMFIVGFIRLIASSG